MFRRSSAPHVGLLVLRVGLGLSVMLHHGADKLFGGPAVWADIGGVLRTVGLYHGHAGFGLAAAFAEFCGGGLLALGLCTRPALTLLLGTMAVAVGAHLAGAVPGSASYAFDLGVVFLALLFTGPGAYSFDAHLDACRLPSEAPSAAPPETQPVG